MATVSQPSRIGKYEVLSTLGRGGMGIVYKARDPQIDRIVAIKTILIQDQPNDDDVVGRLRMEARSAGRLQHTNVVTVYDFGHEGEMSYIVMEYVDGINLAKIIEEKRPLSLSSKLEVLLQICEGLAYAHEQGVVHRDMKPSNVCITTKGVAKILDFGLARFDDTRLTRTGFLSGTIAYMSPERFGGTTGPQDDIFALGAIAYELLTYQRAFPGSTPPEVMSRIITGAPAAPSSVSDVPPEIDVYVLKALAREQADRYSTATHFAHDLRKFMQTPAYASFISEPERVAAFQRSVEEFVDKHQSSGHAYAGPATLRRPDDAPLPTLRMNMSEPAFQLGLSTMQHAAPQQPATDLEPTVALSAPSTEPKLEPTVTMAATEVVPMPASPRRNWLPIAAAGVVLVGAIVFFALRGQRGDERPAQQPEQRPAAGQPAGTTINAAATPQGEPQSDDRTIQLAAARSLSDQLASRGLKGDDLVKFAEAKARLDLADQKFRDRHYDDGSRLLSDAVARLNALARAGSASGGAAIAPVIVPLTPGKKNTTKQTPPAVAVQPQPQPPPVAAATPQPQPAQQPPPSQPQPQPAKPAVDPEKEIAAFMRAVASAYTAKDTGFFSEHVVNYTPALANAIRNSPSVRVEIEVRRIDVRDAQHASVSVRRTDHFPEASAPPAVQTLTYELTRSDGWKIAAIRRE
jgi:serine/threonine protein kinase